MDNADRMGTAKEALQRFGLPTAAGIIGAGAGLILTKKRDVGGSVSGIKNGVGDLVDDLRQKLESVTNRAGAGSEGETKTGSGGSASISPDELAERLRTRGERRQQRRSRSRS